MFLKKLCLALILIGLLCGCSYQYEISSSALQTTDNSDQSEISSGQPQVTDNEQKALFLIHRYPYSYKESFECNGLPFSESDREDDEALQGRIQGMNCRYPITEGSQITAFAWDFYEICVNDGRLEAEYVPYAAMSYTDGIWSISFLPEEDHGSYYDDKSYFVLISANDGHIISFQMR